MPLLERKTVPEYAFAVLRALAVLAVVAVVALPVVFWLNVGHVNVPVLKLPEAGVPKRGVTKVGDVARTTAPEPVEVVAPVPPAKTGNVPAVSVEAPVEYRALLAPTNVVSPVPP